jgi:hypothetical protein
MRYAMETRILEMGMSLQTLLPPGSSLVAQRKLLPHENSAATPLRQLETRPQEQQYAER